MKRNDDWVTALQQWHWGKILMLWIVVPTIGVGVGFGFGGMTAEVNEAIAGVIVLLLSVGSIVVMLGVTWLWLTGKERRD